MLDNFANSPRRNKYEIWVEILNLCSKNQIHLSRIIRELRLRTSKCKEYVSFLIQQQLLDISEEKLSRSIIYSTSRKGKEAVNDFLALLSRYFS